MKKKYKFFFFNWKRKKAMALIVTMQIILMEYNLELFYLLKSIQILKYIPLLKKNLAKLHV